MSQGTVHTLLLVSTSLQRQRPLERVPNCQKNLLTPNSYFHQRLMKKSRMVLKFDLYGTQSRRAIVFRLSSIHTTAVSKKHDTFSVFSDAMHWLVTLSSFKVRVASLSQFLIPHVVESVIYYFSKSMHYSVNPKSISESVNQP